MISSSVRVRNRFPHSRDFVVDTGLDGSVGATLWQGSANGLPV